MEIPEVLVFKDTAQVYEFKQGDDITKFAFTASGTLFIYSKHGRTGAHFASPGNMRHLIVNLKQVEFNVAIIENFVADLVPKRQIDFFTTNVWPIFQLLQAEIKKELFYDEEENKKRQQSLF